MKIAFIDESTQDAAEKYTACGLTLIEGHRAPHICEEINKVRATAGLFPNQKLKWALSDEISQQIGKSEHTAAKNECLNILSREAEFFGYLHLNPSKDVNDAVRNSKFGFNTLLAALNRHLTRSESYCFVVFDRLDWEQAYEYCAQKLEKGLTFPGQLDRADEPLDRILGYSMSAARMSRLSSLNDIATGALSFVANYKKATKVRAALCNSLIECLPKGPNGLRQEHSFFVRPKGIKKLGKAEVENREEVVSYISRMANNRNG